MLDVIKRVVDGNFVFQQLYCCMVRIAFSWTFLCILV